MLKREPVIGHGAIENKEENLIGIFSWRLFFVNGGRIFSEKPLTQSGTELPIGLNQWNGKKWRHLRGQRIQTNRRKSKRANSAPEINTSAVEPQLKPKIIILLCSFIFCILLSVEELEIDVASVTNKQTWPQKMLTNHQGTLRLLQPVLFFGLFIQEN